MASDPSPPNLADSHIFSEVPSLAHGFELIPSVGDGLGARGAVTLIAAPATEPGGDPGEPCERAFLVRVLLLVGPAFEGAVESDRKLQLVRGNDLAGAALLAVACDEQVCVDIRQDIGLAFRGDVLDVEFDAEKAAANLTVQAYQQPAALLLAEEVSLLGTLDESRIRQRVDDVPRWPNTAGQQRDR